MRSLPCLVVLVFAVWGSIAAEPEPRLHSLPVTNGLIRFWPNPADLRDEISGQEGIAMGVMPKVSTDPDESVAFNHANGWVNLAPAITNEVFTIAFWLFDVDGNAALIGQQTPTQAWLLEVEARGDRRALVFVGADELNPDLSEAVSVQRQQWTHFAIARKTDGSSRVWTNGVLALEGRKQHAWPSGSHWFTVGARPRGGSVFSSTLQRIAAFDRVLTSDEVRTLFSEGRGWIPTRETAARLAATEVPRASETRTLSVANQKLWNKKSFTAEDGLPGNDVKAVLQANNGYLWIATGEGLARFDGKRFRVFNEENTAALRTTGQNIYCLSQESDGTIWAGAFNGLIRIRDLEFTAFTNGLPQKFVLAVAPAGDGAVWVGAFNNFTPRGPLWLRRYHPEAERISAEVLVPGHLRSIHAGPDGLWLATEDPQLLLFWDTLSHAPETVAAINLKPHRIRFAARAARHPELRHRSWVSQSDPNAGWGEIQVAQAGPVFSWLWDARFWRPSVSRIPRQPGAAEGWAAISHGLAHSRQDQLEAVPFTDRVNGPEITTASPDRERGIWFGTEDDGLHHLSELPVRVFTTANGLPSDQVRAIALDSDGSMWAATANGLGVLRGNSFTNNDVDATRVRSVAVHALGMRAYGLAQGGEMAVRFASNAETWSPKGIPWQDPNTLRFAKDGALWVACELGITTIDFTNVLGMRGVANSAGRKTPFRRFGVGAELPQCVPMGVVEGRDGAIWAGSLNGGIFRFQSNRVDRFHVQEGLDAKDAVPVHVDDTGAIWIVSEKGLFCRRNNRFERLTYEDGLPKDRFHDLIEDDLGNFWLTGKRGIHRLVRREVERRLAGAAEQIHSLTLGTRDGLLTPECSSLHYPSLAKSSDGRIWAATKSGLAVFEPSRISLDTRPLVTTIEYLVAGSREIHTTRKHHTEPIEVPPGSGKAIQIHFGAISLLAADRVQFRWKLEGHDSDWSAPSDLRLAFYTNLRPGAYTFHVKAGNAHGVWADKPAQLALVILPHFWQTRAFLGVMLLLGLTSLLAWHYSRLTAQRRAERARLQEALLNEKTRIAEDMHDQLGATLTQIVILGEVAKTQYASSPSGVGTLDRISSAARDLTRSLSELVWATNPQNDSLENLLAYLRESTASQLGEAGLKVRFDLPSQIPTLAVSATFKRNLLLIAREALHNVIKHASATQVRIQGQLSNTDLTFLVTDDGRGFRLNGERSVRNGLANMKKRAGDLGGHFNIDSEPARGTKIMVILPLTHGAEPRAGSPRRGSGPPFV